MVLHSDAPHVSYAEDAEFAITQPRVRVNGVASAVAALPPAIRAPVVWVYVPGRGRYILSLRPHPALGFEESGETSGDSLTFTGADVGVFRIDTAERIAAGSGTYIVYVLQDSGWEPADPRDRMRVAIGTQISAD